MLPLTHRQNKTCKMGDTEEKHLRSCFFPLAVNSDKGKFPHMEILHQISTNTK